MGEKIVLFHGTRAPADSIKRIGLIAGGRDRIREDIPVSEKYVVNKEATLQRVLDEDFPWLRKEDLPSWTYEGELDYERNRPIHLHLEASFDNAGGYADMGGEPAYNFRCHIAEWVIGKFLSLLGHDEERCIGFIDASLYEQIKDWAKLRNGPRRYVVCVSLDKDDPKIDGNAKETWARIEKALSEGLITPQIWKNPCEVRYFGDIPPENIIGIVAVDAPKWGL